MSHVLSLVDEIASKDPNAVIYASGHNPSGAPGLFDVAGKYSGGIQLIKYVAGDKEGNEALVKEIEAKYGRVDTAIANAGISDFLAKVKYTKRPLGLSKNTFTYAPYCALPPSAGIVNTLGPIVLFQAIRDLLNASANPKFIPISSSAGIVDLLSKIGPLDTAAYSMSKTA